MIKISKMENGKLVEFEYTSVSKATKENGATSGMNRKACLRYLEKAGFDMTTLEETETVTRVQTSLIEKFIKECKTVNKQEIKDYDKLRITTLNQAKTTADMDEVFKMGIILKAMQNPTVSREMLHNKLDLLYNEYLSKDFLTDIDIAQAEAVAFNKTIKPTKPTKSAPSKK